MLLSFGMMLKIINIILIIEIFALFSSLFYLRYKAWYLKKEQLQEGKEKEEEHQEGADKEEQLDENVCVRRNGRKR